MYIKKTKFEDIREKIPEWADYVSIDKNGIIFASKNKPTIVGDCWELEPGDTCFQCLGMVPSKVNFSWKDSLTAACWIRDGSVL